MDVLLGDGIFNADGELWRKQRKTASFEFASKNLRDFSAIVFREYSLKLSAILSQASKTGKVVDMQVNETPVHYSLAKMSISWAVHEDESDINVLTRTRTIFNSGTVHEDDAGLDLQGWVRG